jgi:hypothetical protein
MNSKMKTKEDQLFWKQAYYSIHPTLQETGIGMGGFKKPTNVQLNVDVGDTARLNCDDGDNGLIVKVMKYAGDRPWWKGHLFIENEGPCWIVKSLSRPFEVGTKETGIRYLESLPIQDYLLEKVY